jgi:hypothetical protein
MQSSPKLGVQNSHKIQHSTGMILSRCPILNLLSQHFLIQKFINSFTYTVSTILLNLLPVLTSQPTNQPANYQTNTMHCEKPQSLSYSKISQHITECNKFTAVFTRAYHWFLSWARWIQSIPPHPISLRSISIPSSHLCFHQSLINILYHFTYIYSLRIPNKFLLSVSA